MNTQTILKDCAIERQPVLLLLRKDGKKRWRLNYNIRQVEPLADTENDEPGGIGVQYECDFVPRDSGIESDSYPDFGRFIPLLEERGVEAADIDLIKVEYDGFVNAIQKEAKQ